MISQSSWLAKAVQTPGIIYPLNTLVSFQVGDALSKGVALGLQNLSANPETLTQAPALFTPSEMLAYAGTGLATAVLNFGFLGSTQAKSHATANPSERDDQQHFKTPWRRFLQRQFQGGFFAQANWAIESDTTPLSQWSPATGATSAAIAAIARTVGRAHDWGQQGRTPVHKIFEYGLPGTVGKFKALPAITALSASFFGSYFLLCGWPTAPLRWLTTANGLLLGPMIFSMALTAFGTSRSRAIATDIGTVAILNLALSVAMNPSVRDSVAYASDLGIRLALIAGLATFLSWHSPKLQK